MVRVALTLRTCQITAPTNGKESDLTYQQSQQDLQDHLGEQRQFLTASCDAFDNGFEGEGKRLATAIRVLFHDTSSSQSLLKQLGVKDRIQMLDTAHPYDPSNLLSHEGLVISG